MARKTPVGLTARNAGTTHRDSPWIWIDDVRTGRRNGPLNGSPRETVNDRPSIAGSAVGVTV